MLKRTRAAAVAVAVGAGAIALAPPAAAAPLAAAAARTAPDPVVSNVAITPDPVVVTGAPVTAKFAFTTRHTGDVEFRLRAPGAAWATVKLTPEPHGLETRWTASKEFGPGAAGQWSYVAVARAAGKPDDTASGKFTVESRKVLDTRIVDFGARPDPIDRGDTLTVRGRLQLDGRLGWDGYAGREVAILFRADGSSRWTRVAGDRTDADGRFSADTAAVRSGSWRAEFGGDHGAEGVSSPADHVTVREPEPEPEPELGDSRISSFNASPEPVRHGRHLKFRGTLQVRDGWGWDGHRAKVRLYFKPDGARRWHHVKNTWSTGSGKIYTKARAYRSGHWKLVFKGDGDFYGDSSRADHVRVRR
jgi:hypothetical protein